MSDYLQSYGVSICTIAILALTSAVQNIIAGAIKNGIEKQPSGQPVAGDMSSFSFRAVRTHLNGVENLPGFYASAFAAILLGLDPRLVSAACWTVLITRMVYWAIYYLGIGDAGFGPRSIAYFFTPVATIFLGVLAILRFW